MQPPPIAAVVPAAGSGTRFGNAVPKQYLRLGDREVLAWTLQRLAAAGASPIVIAVNGDERDRAAAVVTSAGVAASLVEGGATRQESVIAALRFLSVPPDRLVAVHDAVRPSFGREMWERLLEAAAKSGAAIPAIPVTDTVHRVDGGVIAETPQRETLVLAQTPQIFRFGVLLDALEHSDSRSGPSTDEAAVVARAGYPVTVVPGEPWNIKITAAGDLEKLAGSLPQWSEW